jgi:two-component system, OmpR family, sensor kinase
VKFAPTTLRGRLTVLFAATTVLLSAVLGTIVVLQYRSELRSALDDRLATRFDDAQSKVAAADADPSDAQVEGQLKLRISEAESFAQILDARGKVLASAPRAPRFPSVLSSVELKRAQSHRFTLVRSVPPRNERSRLLIGPARLLGAPVVVAVGTSLEGTANAEHRLELALFIGLPVLSALLSFGGWLAIGAALSPVQSIIEEADSISARSPGRRLGVRGGAGAEITELTDRLNAMLARIEGALAHERAFLDEASHELRTPIAIVRGELELVRMRAEAGTDLAVALDSALEEVDRLDRLAVNLLVLARTRAAGTPEPAAVDLGVVARRAVDAIERARGSDGITSAVHGSASVLGDAATLERAVTNLVDNAWRYSASTVDVSVLTVGGDACIDVIDDGPGFPPELLDHVFGRFVSTDGGGTAGLGLAIVDAIVSAHGGTVQVSNQSSGGARVRIRLPTAPAG